MAWVSLTPLSHRTPIPPPPHTHTHTHTPPAQHRACPTGRAWFDEFAGFNHVHRCARTLNQCRRNIITQTCATQCSEGYECSNRGHCDVTRGVCKCDERFEGTACHRLKCPRIQHAGQCQDFSCQAVSGKFSSDVTIARSTISLHANVRVAMHHAGKQSTMECGGHGTCMSMSDLARWWGSSGWIGVYRNMGVRVHR